MGDFCEIFKRKNVPRRDTLFIHVVNDYEDSRSVDPAASVQESIQDNTSTSTSIRPRG